MDQKPGFKQSKTPSTKDRIRALEVNLKNSQQAVQISQMMIKQLMQQIDMLRQDSTNTLNRCNDLQYRTLAMINVGSIDTATLDAEADRLKLKDYNDASDKEDKEKGYTIGTEVKDESVVIVTSTTDQDNDQGIFRSKIPVVQIPFEQMKKDIVGKKVGDKFDADIQGVMHNIEILGIRELPKKLEVVEGAAVEVKEDCCGGNCGEECQSDCETKSTCAGGCLKAVPEETEGEAK